MALPLVLAAGAAASIISSLADAATKPPSNADRARAAAQDFEAVFLNTVFQQMFAGLEGDGPMGAGGAGTWRSFLTDEYAKSFAKAGGVGLADQVYAALLAQQEIGR